MDGIVEICHRAVGRRIHDCTLCRIRPWDRENGGGWLPCPPLPVRKGGFERRVAFSGDLCQDCGSAAMVRTGTCMTCQNCGSSSGGCS
jgi:hypothetical protein